ncbi:hypothetical protein Pfo_004096 [Paulownia fortunei]|nr:hypothetical protein Pfo_004096 [Paulownia fortunei]
MAVDLSNKKTKGNNYLLIMLLIALKPRGSKPTPSLACKRLILRTKEILIVPSVLQLVITVKLVILCIWGPSHLQKHSTLVTTDSEIIYLKFNVSSDYMMGEYKFISLGAPGPGGVTEQW